MQIILFKMINILITSPLEQFEVTKFIGVDSPIIGINLSLSNLGFYSILSILIILTYHILSNNNFKIIPSN
jgi:F-type H+-transporting ATPase subunit a